MATKRGVSSKFDELLAKALVVRAGTRDLDDVDDRDPASRAQDKLRDLLFAKTGGQYMVPLEAELKKQRGIPARRLCFLLAEYYAREGEVKKLKQLTRSTDPWVWYSVLEGLQCAVSDMDEAVYPLAVELAVAGMKSRLPAVRATACSLMMNIGSSTDASKALSPIKSLLSDRDEDVRLAATCAVGNLAEAGYDMSRCVAGLGKNVRNEGCGEYAAQALARLAIQGVDASACIADLVWLLEQPHDYSEPIRYGTSALLNCAKSSTANAKRVKAAVAKAKFPKKTKLLVRFEESLAALPGK